jgi:enoyl-CoA hydratase/carnithine racemase
MGARIETGQNSELFMKSFQTLHQQLDSLHKPIYAAVNGSTGGGGMTLIAAADQAFAAPKVQFLLPEICSGAAPCFALQKLHGQLPKKVLFKMASTGKAKTAEELETYGFITTAKDAEAAALEAAIAVSRHSMEAMQKICGILK